MITFRPEVRKQRSWVKGVVAVINFLKAGKTALAFSFLVFSASVARATTVNTFIIGIEDLQPTWSDFDYQDMVLQVTGLGLTIVPNGVGSWIQMPIPNSDRNPYWDGSSSDGANSNIGNFITATGGFVSNVMSPDWNTSTTVYWGVLGGGYDPGILFSASGQVQFKILAEVGSLATQNSLWVYNSTTPGFPAQLYTGLNTVGDVSSFNPGLNLFGLKFVSPGGTYFSNGDGGQFSIFKQGTPDQIPEPASLTLIGLGLLGIGLRKRFRT